MLSLLRGPRAFALAAILVLVVGGSALALSGGDTEVKASRAANCPPHARDDAARAQGTEPAVIDVLANDTDPDGDALLFTIIDSSDGSVKVDQNSTPTDSTDDRISYTPSAGATGVETITYEVEDSKGLTDRAKVTIEIGAPAPEATGELGPPAVAGADPEIAAGATTEPSLDGLVPDREASTSELDARCGSRPRATKATTTTAEGLDDSEFEDAPDDIDTDIEADEEDGDSTKASSSDRSTSRRTGGTTTTTRKSTSGSAPNSGSTGGDTGGDTTPGTGGDPAPAPDPDPDPAPDPDPGDDDSDDDDSPACGQPGQPSCRDYICEKDPRSCRSTSTTQPPG